MSRSLTDVWPHLPHPARRKLLVQLEREARDVRVEAAEKRRRRAVVLRPVVVEPCDEDDLGTITDRRRALLEATEHAPNGQGRNWMAEGRRHARKTVR